MPIKIRAVIITLTIVFFTIIVAVYLSNSMNVRKLSVRSIDGQNIFVGDKNLNSAHEGPNLGVNKVDHAIDLVWDNIHLGNVNFKAKNYEEAAKHYKKALEIDTWTGGGGVAGKYLVESYEVIGRYDEALESLDYMVKRFYKTENGEWKTKHAQEFYEATRTRLLRQKEGGQVAAKKRAGE